MILARSKKDATDAQNEGDPPKRRYTGFQKLCLAYLFAVFALPQYFGVPLPGFALTAQRALLICLFVAILTIQKRADAFFISNTGLMGGHIMVVAPFVFVSLATAILRSDPKSFLNFFADAFLPMLLMVYLAANVFTLDELLRFFKVVLIVVCIVCYMDALVLHKNPYELMHTIKSIEGGSTWRASSYRVAAMASHPIGLGMYFILMTPLMCIDVKGRTINIAKNWGTVLLVCGAVLFTGSRMPQTTFVLELIILFALTERRARHSIALYVLVFGTLGVLLIILLRNESHIRRYVILNLYQVIDSIFGTQLSLNEFGYWQWALINSSTDYRDLLPQLLFSDDYDPLLGLGVTDANYSNFSANVEGRHVVSIDNFYVMQFLQFAWPGLISIVIVFVYMTSQCMVSMLRKGNVLCKALLVSFVLYIINLWFVADLGTFKYVFSLFGLAFAYAKGAGISQVEKVAQRG